MLALSCPIQNYEWGRRPQESEVASLAEANGLSIDEKKYFAELWMGTHVNGPAVLADSEKQLGSWIHENTWSLGGAVQEQFGPNLPFLFKVLSVRTALSIQSHPDKRLAKQLHASHPQHYKDDNHKPEMAIAISEFEALAGFRSIPEIVQAVSSEPEILAILDQSAFQQLCTIAKQQTSKLPDGHRSGSTFLVTAEESSPLAVTAAGNGAVTSTAAGNSTPSVTAAGNGSTTVTAAKSSTQLAPAVEAIPSDRLNSSSNGTLLPNDDHTPKGHITNDANGHSDDAEYSSSQAEGQCGNCAAQSTLDAGAATSTLRTVFLSLMSAPERDVAIVVDDLVQRLKERESAGLPLSPHQDLALRLAAQYPRDVGVIAAFFLNLVTMAPGQALVLAANEPHAYVSGELVEVMAASDNVIRAGLTPKFKHVDVLCESLTYTTGAPAMLAGEKLNEHVTVYRPPFDEFEVQRIQISEGKVLPLPVNEGPVIMLVQHGAGTAEATGKLSTVSLSPELQSRVQLKRGMVLMVPAGTPLQISSSQGDLLIWAAACNGNFLAQHTQSAQVTESNARDLAMA